MGMFRWDYMINCNEKENDYENKDHIIKKPKRWKDTNIQNITCLGKIMQHLSNIWD